MNVGDLVWVKACDNANRKQLGIIIEPVDWNYEGTIWKVQRLDVLGLRGIFKPHVYFPGELEKVNESR